jgi:hypothetical protein
MWELHHGTIPPGMDICHTCDVRACCRPEHLFIGTRLMNVRDCIAKKRNGAVTKPSSYRRGIRHHAAKLNPSQVADIRAIYQAGGVTKAMLARQYGIARTTLHSIVTYRTWK